METDSANEVLDLGGIEHGYFTRGQGESCWNDVCSTGNLESTVSSHSLQDTPSLLMLLLRYPLLKR